MRRSILRLAGLGLTVAAILALVPAEPISAGRATRPRITWSVGASRHFQLTPGDVIEETISFTSDRDIQRASVVVFPTRTNYVSLRGPDDDDFAREVVIGEVIAGESYSLELRSDIPVTTIRRASVALISVKDKHLKLNRSLRVLHRINYTAWRRLFPVQRPTRTPTRAPDLFAPVTEG